MANSARQPLLTPRDLEVLAALDHCPLTAAQLLKFSHTFALPFTGERRVRERLQVLAECGRVRRWLYATAGRGALNYYTLSRLGYALLHGADAPVPGKRAFAAIGLARQFHARALADVIVHTAVSAHRAGLQFTGFCRENALPLTVGQDTLYPDCAFQLVTPAGRTFAFYVELDNSTERIRSAKDADSWERKVRLYDRLQDKTRTRFRLLVVATRSAERLANLLSAAAEVLRNSQRALVYGVTLCDYLAAQDPISTPCFRDHAGRLVSLLPRLARTSRPMVSAPSLAIAAAGR
jgi:hypothetical protein